MADGKVLVAVPGGATKTFKANSATARVLERLKDLYGVGDLLDADGDSVVENDLCAGSYVYTLVPELGFQSRAMAEERVWVRFLDSTLRFRCRNGRLDADEICKKWKLDPESLVIGPDAIAVGDDGLSKDTVVEIRQAASEVGAGDGKSQHTPFLLEATPSQPFQAAAADPADNSRAWACAVLKPFDFSVLEVEGLKRALSEPLPLPLPVLDVTYNELVAIAVSGFVPNHSYPAERIASIVTTFIHSRTGYGKSENWDNAFCILWQQLLALADITTVDYDRNVTDRSGASVSSTRPDLMLWILNRLCAKFEEKKLSIEEAYLDLQRKLCSLPAVYYGPVSWMIGVALAGDRMEAWAMRPGQWPESLSKPLRMTSFKDKAACLCFSVNLLRVALSLSGTYKTLVSAPRPYRSLPTMRYGKGDQISRRLQITDSGAIKEVSPWSEHVAEGFTMLETVTAAYNLRVAGLVSGKVQVRADRYKVTMDMVGFPQNVTSEAELVVGLRDVLTGLKALHAADLVHRDVRWANVLRILGDGFVLIDFETVWWCDEKPSCCKLRAWDEDTLVDGKFTRSSDLQLVGKLMPVGGNMLSERMRSFQLKLLNHQFASADQALEELRSHPSLLSVE